MLLQVTVPAGLQPGDPMSIEYEGQEFNITVPDGCFEGMAIEVDLPVGEDSTPPPPPAANVSVEVVVPDDVFAGEEFLVEFDGQQFNIAVPEGCGPGDPIQVEVPAASPPPEAAPPAAAPPPEQQQQPPQQRAPPPKKKPRPPARTPYEMVGRRAALCGLIAKAILNGKKGTVMSYNEDRDRLVVAIDGVTPDVAVKMSNLAELPEDDVAPIISEPPEAPPAGIYYVGDRVKMERSNGEKSPATVVEFDEVMETYTLDIGGGILKYGVEESYIYGLLQDDDKMYTTEWAGKHFVGRKVRLPHLPCWRCDHDALLRAATGIVLDHECDKNGAIRTYDDRTKRYMVLMESGEVETAKFEQLKVSYSLLGQQAQK